MGANLQNLVPNSARTPEERRQNARKAGLASGVSRAKHKAMKESLLELLSLPMRKGRLTSSPASVEDLKGANVTIRERILISMATKAAKGDVKAAEFIRDTIGEAPKQEVVVEKSAVSTMTDEELRRIASGEV